MPLLARYPSCTHEWSPPGLQRRRVMAARPVRRTRVAAIACGISDFNWIRLVGTLAALSGVVLVPVRLNAQACADYRSFLHEVNAFDPGTVARIASDGSVVCGIASITGTSNQFFVLDLTNPSTPSIAATAPVTGVDLEVVDGIAYVVGSTGMTIVDVHNPFSPLVRGTVSTTAASDVAVAGTTAYLALGTSGIR